MMLRCRLADVPRIPHVTSHPLTPVLCPFLAPLRLSPTPKMHRFASVVVLAALAALAAAQSPPQMAGTYQADVELQLNYEGGYAHSYAGVVDQQTNKYSLQLNDVDGDYFHEAYELVPKTGCVNFQVLGNACNIGCKGDVACGGHSCSCGGARGLFQYLGNSQMAGKCAGPSGQKGTVWRTNVGHSDDDAERPQTVDYCMGGAQLPIYINKTYNAPVADDALDRLVLPNARKLQNARIEHVFLSFKSVEFIANNTAFELPSGCVC